MKLVRDKIPKLYPNNEYRLANSWETDSLLRLKVAEEVGELIAACTQENLEEEIADTLEALEALAHLHGLSLEGSVRQARDVKRAARGGFSEWYILTEYKGE